MGMTALDHEEIKQLLARYCHAIDFTDADGLVSCFAPDATFDGPDHLHTGHDELRTFAAQVAAKQLGHVRHSTVGSLIDGDGRTARAVSNAFITRDYGPAWGAGRATHSAVLTTGIYTDDLVKLDGRWVFSRRMFRHDGWPDTLALVGKPLTIAPFEGEPEAAADGTLSPLDHEEIRQLLTRYCYTLDFEDTEGFVDCFTPDGVFGALSAADPLAGVIRGHDRLREFAMEIGKKVRGHARHSCISPVIVPHPGGGSPAARVSCYGFIPMDYGTPRQWGQRDNATVGTTGVYRDHVVKAGGRWRFARRTFRYDGWPDVAALLGRPSTFELFE